MNEISTSAKTDLKFTKKVIKNKSCRKRTQTSDEGDSGSEQETSVIVKNKKRRKNLLVDSSKKESKTEKLTNDSSDDSLNEDDMKSIMVSYKSTREIHRSGPSDMGATAVLETETETDKDAQAIFENALKINKELKGNYCNTLKVVEFSILNLLFCGPVF